LGGDKRRDNPALKGEDINHFSMTKKGNTPLELYAWIY
jgi:hypothetical protein